MEAEEYARLQGWGPKAKQNSDGDTYWVLTTGSPCGHHKGLKVFLQPSGYFSCFKSGCVAGYIEEIRGPQKPANLLDYPTGSTGELQAAQKVLAENPDSDAALHFRADRSLSGSTIAEFRLGVVDGCPAIPAFDAAGRFLAHKLRDLDPKAERKYRWSTGGKVKGLTLWNAHKLDRSLDFVYVTEGEFDAMALWQMGYRNVVSLPHGASDKLPRGMQGLLDGFSRIFLLYDPDEAGISAAKAHAEALGVWRTARVLLPGTDISKALKVHTPEDFERWINMAQEWDGGVLPFSGPLDIEIEQYGKKIEECPAVPWKNLQWLMSGFRPGEITVFSGDTSTGKTTKSLEICWSLAKQGIGTYIISSEMQPRALSRKLLQFEGGRHCSILEFPAGMTATRLSLSNPGMSRRPGNACGGCRFTTRRTTATFR